MVRSQPAPGIVAPLQLMIPMAAVHGNALGVPNAVSFASM